MRSACLSSVLASLSNMSRPRTIAFIAGETSGDQLGGWLMSAIHHQSPETRMIGIGGPMMEAEGLASIFPMQEISLMGFAEVLPHVFRIRRRIVQTVAFLETAQPDAIISIDSPGFVLRVMEQLIARGRCKAKRIHYVAPTVWAYKPQRAKIMAARFDHLLCILPFEPPYFEAEGLATSFVGHEIAWWWKTRGDGQAFRQKHGLGDAPLLAVFPGSRQGEITRLWPIFRESITRLHARIPGLRVVLQVPPMLLARLQQETKNWDVPCLILSNREDKKDLFAAATAAIAKSGTIGLECALAGLPSIVAYRATPITAMLLRRMIRVPYVNLANLLLKRPIIPELIQERCTAEEITTHMLALLTDKTARATQQRALGEVAAMLGTQDTRSPSEKAASIVLRML
jgi:lipid-A-disaccharide synthase